MADLVGALLDVLFLSPLEWGWKRWLVIAVGMVAFGCLLVYLTA